MQWDNGTNDNADFLLQSSRKVRKDNHSSWLVSYGDLITQLLVFFIVIASISKVSTQKLVEVQSNMQGSSKYEDPLEKIEKALSEVLTKHHLSDYVKVAREADGIAMIIKDSLLFASGADDIPANAATTLAPVFKALKDLPQLYRFSIEGHTDDAPIAGGRFVSNWHLSAMRALSVLELFKTVGFEERRLSVHGYGSEQPLAPNRDASGNPLESNMSQNRRVVIRVR